jgi:HD-GYP domain-containing protein (c-di-GMP phosphodiesterase class II)
MLYEGELLGLLVAASRRADAFSEKDVNVLFAIASQLSPVLKNALLLEQLRATASDLESAYHYTMTVLASLSEARDPYTGKHLQRIRTCSETLATELGLTPQQSREVGLASLLHDLGKVHLPDSILAKRGPLTAEEWKVIKVHPLVGEEILGPSPLFNTARQIARWHHERWDGSGYPDGLREEDIPLAARIVSVADSFDALISERPYKQAWPVGRAVAEIIGRRGREYCPSVVDAFERLHRSGKLQRLAQITGQEPLAGARKAA